ncbi:MAG: DNA recombination protein RmuC [Bacteroidota bacterium]|nr:DNA recombination protein RmuC [Bacteroidota bacterium]
MDFISFLIGMAAGIVLFGLAYWLFRKPNRSDNSQQQIDFPSKIRELELDLSRIQTEKIGLSDENTRLNGKLDAVSKENINLLQNLASSKESIVHLNEKLENQARDIEKTQKSLQTEFKNLANDILEEKTKKFTEQNSKRLDDILIPFKNQMTGFEKRVEDTYQKTLKDQTDLQVELKKLQDLNIKISQEANNLTRALKGDVKKQGNWGEMILERVLERSGLAKGVEYEVQESFATDEGKRIQPDVVIHLPEKKHILIDAKVSLVAYNELVNTDNADDEADYLKNHLISIRKHVKELAEKNYQNTKGIQSPDFVLMFIPIEASFSVAVKEDPSLFNEAWEKHIVIVSPTTLLATLMTIASIWKQENQTKNAIKIADEGAKLYDKFVHFLEDLDKLGEKLNAASKHYDDSMRKLKTGKGNLISKVEGLKLLGVRSKNKTRSIPESLADYDQSEVG